jgi:hypothetical protein
MDRDMDMTHPRKVITTVKRVLGVDVVDQIGIVVRLLAKEGTEHHIQIPAGEAHGAADMMAIALMRLPATNVDSRNS